MFMVLPFSSLIQQTLPSWEWYMGRNCMESHLHCICVLVKYEILWLLNGMDYGKFRLPEFLHDKDHTSDMQPANLFMFVPFSGHEMLWWAAPVDECGCQSRFQLLFSRVQNAGTQCLQDLIPSSFKAGRHSYWWLSILHLMHSWAQMHRQSLFGMCASKSESCWMILSSSWPTTIWL